MSPRSLLAALLLATPALAQDLLPKAPPQQLPVVIVNATIHTASGTTIPVGSITFERGVITEITEGSTPDDAAFTADRTVINAKGQHVYPGLIAANTQLGLTELAAVRATNDINETGDLTPEARAATAVNPDSTLLPVTRTNGILVVGVFPEGGRVAGQVSVMRLDGWTWEQMAIRQNAGLTVEWPAMRPVTAWWMDRSEEDQQRDIRRAVGQIDDLFRSAEAYAALRAADPATPADTRLDAVVPTLPAAGKEQRPVFVAAGDLDQITAAVTWAQQRKLRLVIVGGRDAPLCADLLKKHDVPVIITGTHAFPKRADSPYDDAYTLPKRLADAGVRFCIASADRTAHERNLPYNASTAVAHGLPRDEALKSLTLYPAQILGIDAAYGSLEKGKSATLFISSGDALAIDSNPTHAWIDGRKIDLANKQSALAAKYREKYRQLKDAPGEPQPAAAPGEGRPQAERAPTPRRVEPPRPASVAD